MSESLEMFEKDWPTCQNSNKISQTACLGVSLHTLL